MSFWQVFRCPVCNELFESLYGLRMDMLIEYK
ncbi:C2H2-type zinc finger protein [Desulforamulus reducens]